MPPSTRRCALANEARDDDEAAARTAGSNDERASDKDMVDGERRMSVIPTPLGAVGADRPFAVIAAGELR